MNPGHLASSILSTVAHQVKDDLRDPPIARRMMDDTGHYGCDSQRHENRVSVQVAIIIIAALVLQGNESKISWQDLT